MKLTRYNRRMGKNGAYNLKHNDRQFDVANSDHIDQERSKMSTRTGIRDISFQRIGTGKPDQLFLRANRAGFLLRVL